jgi:hypothetical protein
MAECIREVGDPKRPLRLTEDPETIIEEPSAFFLEYWRDNRSGASLPLRKTFVPKDAKAHLGWVIVADALEGFVDFRYRVVGSRVCDYFLGNGTGKTVREALAGTSELMEGTLELYRLACMSRIPVRLQGPASTYNQIFFPSYDSLYLPYSLDGERADRIVAVFTFNYQNLIQRRQSAALRLA